MNDETSVDRAASAQPGTDTPTAGALLRRAREAAGLHVAALAVALKVPVKKLEALEADRWDLLPDAVFVRALASSVCRSLKINPVPVLDRLPQQARPRLDAEERGINTPFRASGYGSAGTVSAFVARPVVLVVAFLLLAALAVLLVPEMHFSGKSATPAAMDTPPVAQAAVVSESPKDRASAAPAEPVADVAAAPPVASPPPVAVSTPAPAPAQALSALAAKPGASASVAAAARASASVAVAAVSRSAASGAQSAASAATQRPVADSGAVNSSGHGLLVFRVKAATWVEVSDAQKQVLLRRTLAAGEALGVNGDLPLAVVVGRVDGVAVEVRGKPLALDAIGDTNVARFEVK